MNEPLLPGTLRVFCGRSAEFCRESCVTGPGAPGMLVWFGSQRGGARVHTVCRVSVVVMLATLATWATHAEGTGPDRADKLLLMCSSDRSTDRVACVSYLIGFLDGVVLQAAIGRSRIVAFCQPADGISGEQARRIVLKWFEQIPERLHEPARIHVALALKQAFPCKE